MNWDSPEQRLALIESVGITEYNRLIRKHHEESVVATVNGYAIRPVGSRFGIIFMIEGTTKGFSKLDDAKAFAAARTSTTDMSEQLQAWCGTNDLPYTDAAELTLRSDLRPEQAAWLRDFCTRWDAAVDAEDREWREAHAR